MDIHIKNMVCDRCVMVVSTIFKEAGIDNANVQLGKVTVENPIDSEIFKQVVIRLKQVGFETINDSKSQLTEQLIMFIKTSGTKSSIFLIIWLIDSIWIIPI